MRTLDIYTLYTDAEYLGSTNESQIDSGKYMGRVWAITHFRLLGVRRVLDAEAGRRLLCLAKAIQNACVTLSYTLCTTQRLTNHSYEKR